MASLRAIAGPIKGAVFQLAAETVNIGRQTSNQLCIGDPSVSREHCRIEPAQGQDSFRIRDLESNNGTFVDGKRIDAHILTNGDRIRIGDTVFVFGDKEDHFDEQATVLSDNGVVVNSCLERQVSEAAETALNRLSDGKSAGEFAKQAGALLNIGAKLQKWQDREAMEIEILKLILEIVPADQAAIVILDEESSTSRIAGWNRHSGTAEPISMSRTLVKQAMRTGAAISSHDVRSSGELSDITSLIHRRVDSVMVVPLATDERAIGAIYLESNDSRNRLLRDHMEFVAVVADHAGTALERIYRLEALKEENRRLHSELKLNHNLIGTSLPMRQICERIAKIARTDATAMIRGETGTGKELAARAIHENSARAGRPFEAINCSLLRDTLLESELFGHEKGSFTGAIAQKKGKLELAAGGTLFLDELGSLGESPQAMLLRVLQTREFQRLGGSRTIHTDIRIIAATNEDLEDAIRRKAFREDLYYRLNVVSLTMPSLRDRSQDIPLLADHFVQLYSRKNKRPVMSVSSDALALLKRHDWPGNVRELENAIEHAIVFGSTEEILPEDLPDSVLSWCASGEPVALAYHDALREAKRNIVLSAMQSALGDYGQAAKQLGIHVNNLHRFIRELSLKPRLANAIRASSANHPQKR